MIVVNKDKTKELQKYGFVWTGYDYALFQQPFEDSNVYISVIRILKYKREDKEGCIAKVYYHNDSVLAIVKNLIDKKIISDINSD